MLIALALVLFTACGCIATKDPIVGTMGILLGIFAMLTLLLMIGGN